ncbi:unnamed protein product [Ceutorhynchus assimilis]|uniref:ferroxidase n=1 Tax=Ceutorhynchus assimilis TaxID=467358 RepID=A0A9N9MQV0_9CUCU|nr:unnamed protein product [Ceutorhynchus assimilis]
MHFRKVTTRILTIRNFKQLNSKINNTRRISSLSSYNFSKIQSKYVPYPSQTPNSTPQNYYSTIVNEDLVDSNTFEKVCEETLNSLAEYFDELVATEPKLEKADVIYGAGVLNIDLGIHGTYVINRQSPNRQIWLSSPTSGPKRFDYVVKEGCWIYKHDGQHLHKLLENEFENILGRKLNISENCLHSI